MPETPRQRYEALHARQLIGCAVREAGSGGRAHDEPEHDYRTCFQRDRDRIIHCAAFRRLDYKTQVFVPHEHDHFRTRLTHTVEVAQIGRDLGRAIGLNEDLIEAVALAHDLGHPPFGHAGEEALAALMAGAGGFEHNRQSLRVVDYLEHPYPHFRGLNLSRAVRECLARHETRYDHPCGEEFPPGEGGPVEGQVVDLADEIAYTAADLEDALAAEWIAVEQVAPLALWREAWSLAGREAPDARPIHTRIRACKNVLSIMANDAVETTVAAIGEMGLDSPDAVRRAPRKAAGFSPDTRAAVDAMQAFLMDNVYADPRSADRTAGAKRIVAGLFAAYARNPEALPGRYSRRIQTEGLPRVACDYIAGMTDRFCRQEHAKLCE